VETAEANRRDLVRENVLLSTNTLGLDFGAISRDDKMASVVGIRWTNENRFRLLYARVTFSFSDGTAKAQPETLKYKYF